MNQLEEYLKFCSIKGLSNHSIRAYKTDLTKYMIWVVSRDAVTPFSSELLQGWLGFMREKSLSQRTLKRRLASIRAWYNWLIENKLVEASEFSVPKVKVARTLPRNLGREDLATLFKQSANMTDTTQYEELVTVTLVELLFQTGLRISEACSLKLNDYDQRLQSIRVMGKGMRERIVYIVNDDSKNVVTQYLQKRSKLGVNTDLFFLRRNQKPLSCPALFRASGSESRSALHQYPLAAGLAHLPFPPP